MIQAHRGHRQDINPALIDEEGILVGAVRRASVLHDAQPAGGDLVHDAMIEQDHAIRDVFLKSLSGELPFAALAGDDGGEIAILQPSEQAAKFSAKQGLVGEAAEKAFNGVEHDAPGADGFNCKTEPDEQGFKVVLASLMNLSGIDVDVIKVQQSIALESGQIKAKGAHVLREFAGSFFECEVRAGFIEFGGAADDELHGHEGLAAPRAAADQCWAALGQPAIGDFIQAGDAGQGLFDLPVPGCSSPVLVLS